MMGLSGATRPDHHQKPPFTSTQWLELEHQALIYKYMVSGVPVPPELIFSLRRSLDSSLATRLLPLHQPSFGWGCFQMGFGRKPDPEPGRCRRTDGKKWRCSREAYPDSKYCEKHMHRGRNRSRKPVDLQNPSPPSFSSSSSTTTTTNNNNLSLSSSVSSLDSYSKSSNMIATHHHQNSPRFSCTSAYFSHSLYPASSSAKPTDSALSLHQNSSSQFNVLGNINGTCPLTDKDFRYVHGIGDGVGERTLFPEESRSFQDSPYHHRQHCFVLGSDMLKSRRTVTKIHKRDQEQEKEEEDCEPKKPLLHFFGDDWPSIKNSGATDSWLDLASNSSRLTTDS